MTKTSTTNAEDMAVDNVKATAKDTKVDFYVLDKDSDNERLKFVCRFVDKLQKMQKTARIVVEDAQAAKSLDELLWQFPAESFLPHTSNTADPESDLQGGGNNPILIQTMAVLDNNQAADGKYDVLINLSSGPASTQTQHSRIVEVVIQEPNVLTSTRARYKFYREQGYPLQSHPIQVR